MINSRKQYWKWSKPALVLALVALSLTFASFLIQPRIIDSYRRLVAEALEHQDGDLSFQIKTLQRAELAAKRLTQQDADAAARVVAAQLAIESSVAHYALASELRGKGDFAAASVEMEAGRTAMRRANDSMRRAAKSQGAHAIQAQLWLLRQNMNSGPLIATDSDSFWDDILKHIPRGWNDGSDSEETLLLEQARIKSLASLSLAVGVAPRDDGVERVDRKVEIQKLLASLAKYGDCDPRLFMCQLEAIDCLEPGQGVAIARERIKDLLNDRDAADVRKGSQQEVERIDSAFVSLLMLASTEEAIAYAINNLERSQQSDPEILRGVLTQSILRGIGRNVWFPSNADEDTPKRVSGLLKGLFVIGMKYPMVYEMVERIIQQRKDDFVAQQLSAAVEQDHGTGMRDAISWLRSRFVANVSHVDLNEQERTIDVSLARIDESLALPMLGFIAYLIREKHCDSEVAILAIEQMVENWPMFAELKMAEAMVAIEIGRHDQAITKLQELNKQIPNNPQIQNLLLQANERALRSQ